MKMSESCPKEYGKHCGKRRNTTIRPLNPFPHNNTFCWVWERSFLKTLWETEKSLVQAISPFPTMFFTLPNIESTIFVKFNLLSPNAFNMVWSKILLCGNGIINILTFTQRQNFGPDQIEKICADNKLIVANMTISLFDKSRKHCGKRRKIFSFCHIVLQSFLLLSREKLGLCGKE